MTDEESVSTASDTVISTSPAGSVSAPRWTAVAWLLLGMLLGIIAIATYSQLIAAPPANQVGAKHRTIEVEGAAKISGLFAIPGLSFALMTGLIPSAMLLLSTTLCLERG